MKRYLVLLALFLLWFDLNAQTQGTLDTTFNGTGASFLYPGTGNDILYDIEIQSDGYILGTGSYTSAGNNNFDVVVTRLRPEGTIDLGFGVNGYYKKDFTGLFDQSKTLKITPDKKILVGGSAAITSAISVFQLIRLTENGLADSTFGNGNSYVMINHGNSEDYVQDIALQDDGKILCAGDSRSTLTGTRRATIFRLENNGDVDTTFGIGGFAEFQVIPGSTTDYFTTIAIQPDGKIVVAGQSLYNADFKAIVARFLVDGSLDTSFNSPFGYYQMSSQLSHFNDIILDWPNHIIICGLKWSGSRHAGIIGFTFAGMPDPGFGTAGGATIIDFGTEDRFFQMSPQANGKIIAVGSTIDPINVNDRNFSICRFLQNGLLDSAFAVDGHSFISFGTSDNSYSVDIQPDGKIVIGGITGSGFGDLAFLRIFGDNTGIGINEIPQMTLGLYPVPVSGNTINLDPGDNSDLACNIQLFNILGSEIMNWDLPADISRHTLHLDLPQLMPGTYFLRYLNCKTALTASFVVQR